MLNGLLLPYGLKMSSNGSLLWNRGIDCRPLKDQKESGREFNVANMTRSRLVPEIIMKFEAELYQKINDRLLTNPMSFDTVKDVKARLTFFIRPSMSLKIYR